MQGIQPSNKTRHRDEDAVVAVVEFLSAFTLFLMILTAFMSLAQLELGSNDPYTDLVDRSAVDGLDRLTNGKGWFVPYVDGVRDQSNATEDWHQVPVTKLYDGVLQPGIIKNGLLDLDRIDALSNVSIEAMTSGLGLAHDLQVRLLIQVESSSDSSNVGKVLFDGGSDRSTASTSSVASRTFISGNDVISVSLEVHDGGDSPKILRITEFSPRPANGGPEWIEMQNQNGFAISLKGWSFERSGTSGTVDYLYKDGVIPGGQLALFSGDPSTQEVGNASVVYDLGNTGFLGVGSVNGLDDNNGRLRLLFAEEDEGAGSQVCKVEWSATSGIMLDNTLVWNGGPPSKSTSWNVSNTPSPGEV
ncbi:MAG: hypothetical protein ACJZ6A_02080 [Candidatus Poseidoniaceae archaeon]|nr:hypothetical protein [Candidatus Poseidoniales archaeon]|tara:strand:- start:397 stop:1476 length:1080 start_codon:yes stop_codon:yes gene_type:complete